MTDAFTDDRAPFAVPTPEAGRSGRRGLSLHDGKTCSSRSLEPIMSGIPFAAVDDALLDVVCESNEDSPVIVSEELVRKDTPPPADIVVVNKPASQTSSPREVSPPLEKS